MRYWLTAIAAAALTIAGGWIVLLNQHEIAVRLTPAHTVGAPLGAALLAAFALGAAAAGILAAGGVASRAWRASGARRRARREARARHAMARVEHLVWRGETAAARTELLRAPGDPGSEVARLALLAETHLREGDPRSARQVIEQAPAAAASDPRLLDLLARAAEELGDRAAALGALERAYRAAPGSPRLAARLRDLYAAESRWSDAAALQAELLLQIRTPARLAAERATLVGLRYEACLAERDPLRAARQLRALAREAPDFIPAWVSAGDRFAAAGRVSAARRTWLRGLRRRPAAVLLDRLEAHDAAAGQPHRTARLLRSLLRRQPADTSLARRLARHQLARGDLDAAATVLDGLPAPAHALRAELARARGDMHAAAEGFARALGSGAEVGQPWRCGRCGATAPAWQARCDVCHHWDTLRARREGEEAVASAALIRPAN
jgi:thioredoxin-like negative regulator of GroEL